jgi:Ca-activated chloride channel family protein
VAQATGGRFYQAASAEQLRQVYRQLGSRLGHRKESREITAAFGGAGALLLLAASGLSMVWSRRPL